MNNPRLSVGVTKALAKVKAGVPIRKAAAESGVWPQAVYQAIKRESAREQEPTPAKKKAVAR